MPLPNGTRIRERREELDIDQSELAERLAISRGYLRNIEGGHDPIKNQLGHRIARALAISFDEVMGPGDGVPEEPPKQPKPPPTPPKRTERTTSPRRAA